MKKLNHFIAELLYYIHIPIMLGFVVPFFFPSSVWPERIEFHFYYNVGIFIFFYIWGAYWTLRRRDRVYLVCFLTTIMQKIRGHKLDDPKNYMHSFISEWFHRMGIKNFSKNNVTKMLTGFTLLAIFFFVLKVSYGIVLY